MADPKYIVIENYLTSEENEGLLNHAVTNAASFKNSKITYDNRKEEDPAVFNPAMENWRKSQYTRKESFEAFYEILSNQVLSICSDISAKLNIAPFDVDYVEMQMTSHNDGDFYKPHHDNISEKQRSRVLTFVYYFHSIPKQFSGGQLLFFQPSPAIVEPVNNSIVFFDPALKHAVHPISCPGKKFEHSRFTLNGWVRKKTDVASQ